MMSESEDATACACEHEFVDDALVVDAAPCPGDGDLRGAPACRAAVVRSLRERPVTVVRVELEGVAFTYEGDAATLLSVTGAFAARVAGPDPGLAERTERRPLAAARDATGRVGPVAELAAETGFDRYADSDDLGSHLRRTVGPTIAAARIGSVPPPAASIVSTRVLDSGATARVYEVDDDRRYHLEPLEYTFGSDAFGTLVQAHAELATHEPGRRAAHDAVATVATPDQPLTALGRVLAKHSRGYGVLDDLFADQRIDEVYVNAPADETSLSVRLEGRTMQTNVRLTDPGAKLVASRIRMESGLAFSRADPTVDALLEDVGGRDAVRVAGVHPPASDGLAFAFRAEATDEWRLSTLVEVGTMSIDAAGFLSTAMARGAAVLVAGPRGGGKTTLASALLWELPREERILAIEDTPELPLRALQTAGRDAQRLRAAPDDDTALSPAAALRTALRLGDGALAVGEVRGPEAAVLYEAMRVGAASSAVLGTIHGEGADGVRERVVSDLGVPASSFRTTDLVVTIVPDGSARRIASIEEITDGGPRSLFELGPDGVDATGRIERGNSEFVASIAGPAESYADSRSLIDERTRTVSDSSGRDDGPGIGAMPS
ncbi:ATPase, T2SS/T4P/T4SS family [Halanaeroarchaeum sulfurireducens]|uniref:Type II/IV secretion system protein VirB11 n=1 Tax=Halanaeroarchaeum sulfurireducens TaxID=1604004 RepID=A0A0N9MVI7_9EURY|nr:ATPase, T2SS/T4P/T4SS family [Halanaeroarchaeum sulfurireducens]ALG81491.1 type II/IV secretion system protein VirB11 [Halanaeroarchaeum sulfurireducens]